MVKTLYKSPPKGVNRIGIGIFSHIESIFHLSQTTKYEPVSAAINGRRGGGGAVAFRQCPELIKYPFQYMLKEKPGNFQGLWLLFANLCGISSFLQQI